MLSNRDQFDAKRTSKSRVGTLESAGTRGGSSRTTKPSAPHPRLILRIVFRIPATSRYREVKQISASTFIGIITMSVSSIGGANPIPRSPEASVVQKAGPDHDGDADDGGSKTAKAVSAPVVNAAGQRLGQIVNAKA